MKCNVYLVHIYKNGAYDSTASLAFTSKMAADAYANQYTCYTRTEEVPLLSYFDVKDLK